MDNSSSYLIEFAKIIIHFGKLDLAELAKETDRGISLTRGYGFGKWCPVNRLRYDFFRAS